MAKMSDKTKRAINRGRRKAGLKPIKFGSKKKKSKFDRTGKKKDMVAGVDYYKDMRTLLGTKKRKIKKSGIGNW